MHYDNTIRKTCWHAMHSFCLLFALLLFCFFLVRLCAQGEKGGYNASLSQERKMVLYGARGEVSSPVI